MSSACWSLLIVVVATVMPRETTAFQEDPYLSSRRAACNSSGGSRRLACLESRALAWLDKLAGSPLRLELGVASLLPLDHHGVVAAASSRGGEEEPAGVGGGLLGFARRQFRRFASGHALLVPVGGAADALQADAPALVDQEQLAAMAGSREDSAATPTSAADPEEQSRGKKKKKKLALLLPLLFLLKVKLLLVPIVLGVLFIKKLLVLAMLAAPTLIGMVKYCRPPPATPYHAEHAAPPSYHVSGGWEHAGSSLPYHPGSHAGAGWESSPPGEAVHGGDFPDAYGPPHHSPYSRRKWGAQSLAYKAHDAAAAADSQM